MPEIRYSKSAIGQARWIGLPFDVVRPLDLRSNQRSIGSSGLQLLIGMTLNSRSLSEILRGRSNAPA